jgi:hypothetical protein
MGLAGGQHEERLEGDFLKYNNLELTFAPQSRCLPDGPARMRMGVADGPGQFHGQAATGQRAGGGR